ncbi:hypothetical protein J6590_028375 [Homalodisca vitripennis]|nr:hypothetical protein J6590_028375 [Homalodisca vitripennis]
MCASGVRKKPLRLKCMAVGHPIEEEECRWPSVRDSAGSNPVVTVALFISTIDVVMYRLSYLFCLIRILAQANNDVIHAKAYLRGLLIKTGYSDLNEKTLHQIWKSVVLKNCEDGYKKLYMVAVDIHDAYGSMRQDKLLEIVKETSELYMGEDYMNRTVHMDKVHWLRPPICRELHSSSYDTSPHKTTIRKVSDLMCTVQKAVQYQTIKREKRAYLVTKGLSQAVPLSAVLCKLYIAHLDRTRLTELRTKSCDTMVRAVDDYLFITPDNSRASRFLEVMSSGFPEYGLYINPTKTQHNLETCSEIHFFGYVIDSVSLEIYVKFNQGEKAPYRNSFKFSNWTNPLM